MNNQRNVAKIAGWSLVLMAIVAGFSFGFAFPKIYNPVQLDFTSNTLAEHLQLYQFMLLGLLAVILLDILVAWTLYVYFKNDNRKLSGWSFILRMVYTLIFGIATFYLTKNLAQLNSDNTWVVDNFRSFEKLWSIGLIVFGFHLLMVGVLMKLHTRIPKILWYLTIFAGFSYVLIHGLKTIFPESGAVVDMLNIVLGLPMALGELGLAIWLIMKGGITENPMHLSL